MAQTRLREVAEESVPTLVGGEPTPIPAPAPLRPQRAESALTGLLITSLRALSQRTIVALSSLVDFALLASVFAVLLMVINEPTALQLVAVAGYGVFVIVALGLRRRFG